MISRGMGMGLIKGRRGSLTVESAIVLPVIICIILSIAFIMRITYVHSVVQHALNDSANELSTYSYLYSISNLQDLNNQIEGISSDKESTAVNHLDTILGSITSLGQKAEDVKEAASNPLEADIEGIAQIYKDGKADISKLKGIYDEIKGHPKGWKGGGKKEVLSFVTLAAHGLFEKGKGELTGVIMKIMMRKHFATDKQDENTRLLNLNVENGYEGLDFTGTRLFKDKQTIDIIVTYRIKPFLPINILPDIKIVQRAYVRGWLDGDGKHSQIYQKGSADSSSHAADKSLWGLTPLVRGNEIQEVFNANVISSTGGAVDKFEPSTGKGINIRSIDTTLPSYEDAAQLTRTIKEEIDKTIKYAGRIKILDADGKEREYDIKSREVRIIIPKGNMSEIIKTLGDEMNARYNGKVKLVFEEYLEKKASTPNKEEKGQ